MLPFACVLPHRSAARELQLRFSATQPLLTQRDGKKARGGTLKSNGRRTCKVLFVELGVKKRRVVIRDLLR